MHCPHALRGRFFLAALIECRCTSALALTTDRRGHAGLARCGGQPSGGPACLRERPAGADAEDVRVLWRTLRRHARRDDVH